MEANNPSITQIGKTYREIAFELNLLFTEDNQGQRTKRSVESYYKHDPRCMRTVRLPLEVSRALTNDAIVAVLTSYYTQTIQKP